MHIYFLTRGINQQVENFKMYMQTQMWKWTRTNKKTKKKEVIRVQGSLRPMLMWEYVIPEECYNEFMGVLHGNKKEFDSNAGVIDKARIAMLRKMLGAKKFPSWKSELTSKWVDRKGVSIHPIGIRKDKIGVMKEMDKKGKITEYEQEML